jgi:hypothetical protein
VNPDSTPPPSEIPSAQKTTFPQAPRPQTATQKRASPPKRLISKSKPAKPPANAKSRARSESSFASLSSSYEESDYDSSSDVQSESDSESEDDSEEDPEPQSALEGTAWAGMEVDNEQVRALVSDETLNRILFDADCLSDVEESVFERTMGDIEFEEVVDEPDMIVEGKVSSDDEDPIRCTPEETKAKYDTRRYSCAFQIQLLITLGG